MSNQINEATVNLDITGLSSTDMQTLSQILSLAGTAENSSTGSMGGYTSMAGPSVSEVPIVTSVMGTETGSDPMGSMMGAMSAIDDMGDMDISAPGTESSGGLDTMGADALGMPEENPEADMEIGVPTTGSIEDLESDDEFIADLEGTLDAEDPDGNGIPGDQRGDFSADDLMGGDSSDMLSLEDNSDELEYGDVSLDDGYDDEEEEDVEMDNFMEDLGRITSLSHRLTEADVLDDNGHKGVGQIEDDVLDVVGVTADASDLEDDYEEETSMMESLLRLAGVRNYGEVVLESQTECSCGNTGDCSCVVDDNCGCGGHDTHLAEMRMMPNLDLDEDAVSEMGSLGLGANKLYGPYKSSMQAATEAKTHLGGGTSGINFKMIQKPDGFYWSENVNEDVMRPDPHDVCTSAIRNNRHNIKDKVIGLGDNSMLMPVNESVQDLHESLNAAYAKFLGK